MFFEGKDPVHEALRRLIQRLHQARIPYALVGGMAVFAQGYRRTTDDLDILLTPSSLKEFKRHFVPEEYQQDPNNPRRFTDRVNGVTLDVLVTGRFPGSGQPGPIAYPDPEAVSEPIDQIPVVNLATLIQLKLAARRFQDFADVVHLIRAHNLNESYRDRLHPTLHRDYIECLEEKRREDDYQDRRAAQPED